MKKPFAAYVRSTYSFWGGCAVNQYSRLLLRPLAGLLALAMIGSNTPAQAGVTSPVPWAAPVGSWAYYRLCRDTGGSELRCGLLAAIFDPVSPGISEFGLSITYDTSILSFREDLSGPLCSFADGGTCLPVSAAIGTHPVENLLETDFSVGDLLPGSELSYSIFGNEVGFDYILEHPVVVDTAENLFALVFESSIDLNIPKYDFVTYSAASAGIATPDSSPLCGSNTPIGGAPWGEFDAEMTRFRCVVVPTPQPLFLIVFGAAFPLIRILRSRSLRGQPGTDHD
jgi:hypothetical protein